MNKAKTMLSVALLALMGQAAQAASDEKNYLSVDPFYIEPGEVVTVNLNLVNEEAVCAYQTDLVLPEGIKVNVKKIPGTSVVLETGISIVTDRSYGYELHTISSSEQKDGCMRILCYSDQNVCYTGNNGAVATISLIADTDIEAGVYEFGLKNSEVTFESKELYNPWAYTTSIAVGTYAEGILTLAGEYTTEAVEVLNKALAEKDDIMIVDMTSVRVFEGAVEVTNNPNTLIYTSEEIGITNENNVVVDGTCNSLILTDGYPFTTTCDFTVVNGVYNRTLSIGKYGTVVLPFEIDEATKAAYEFYTFKAQGEDYLQFEVVENPTVGTPYLFINKGEMTAGGFVAVGGQVSTKLNEPIVTDGWQMKATYSPISITDAAVLDKTYYISNNKVKNATKSLSINPMRAYIEGPSYRETFGAAQSIGIRLEGTTEIAPIETIDAPIMYDLTGRMVVKMGKGLYIINGKKYYNK